MSISLSAQDAKGGGEKSPSEFVITGRPFLESGPVFTALVRAKQPQTEFSNLKQPRMGEPLAPDFEKFILNPGHTEFPQLRFPRMSS